MHAVSTRRMSRRDLVPLLVFAAAYAIAARLSLLLAIPPGYAAPFWPPAGIALAGLLVGSSRMWPAIWLGSFFTNLWIGFEATASAVSLASLVIPSAIGMGAALQACGGAFLVRRFVGFPSALTRGREVVLFLLMGGPVSCLVNATLGAVTLAVGGKIPWTIALLTWMTWWTGDTLGVLIMTPLMLSWLAQPHHIWRRRRISVALPMVGTLMLAIGIFAYTNAQERERLALLFERQATALGQTLQSSLDNYLDELYAVGSFFASVPAVSRRAFHLFVQRSLTRHPGLQALSWDRRVSDTLRDADGQLVAAARRPEYVVVSYIEPYAGNERALGFDVASAPDRRVALQHARDAGEPRATGRLTLVQAPSHRLGLLVLLPVYDPNLPRATVEERRHSLQGYVVGVLQIDQLIAASLQPMQWEGIVLRIEDETAPAGQGLIYDSRWREKRAPGLVRNDGPGEVVDIFWATSLASADLLRDVLKELRHTYEHRRVDFTIGAFPPCHADPTLLRQVWANLLDNALKFTRQREVARIEIGSQEMAGERVYLVRDNGVGFEMRYMSKLFGVFQRLHHNEGYEGTGVGLALTQRILQRHGGRIWAGAEVDRGATFYFTLGA